MNRYFVPIVLALVLGGCATPERPAPGIGDRIPWSQLPGWTEDRHAEAWPALLAGCQRLQKRPDWTTICEDAALFPDPDDETARAFFETRFEARPLTNGNGEPDGLITGYYEPLLRGSRTRTRQYRYPIYRPPDDLLIVDLGELYPELAGKRLRGRLVGRRVVPYFSREQINNGRSPIKGNELLWVDDPVGLFFLQIQGSGRVRLPGGRIVFVGYADQNGHPYQSIGRRLIEMGALKREDVSLDSIRAWLASNPDQATELLNSNPSYVFFTIRDNGQAGPLGSLNVPLTPERSVAIDPSYIPLGLPLWVDTRRPDGSEAPYRRLMFAQDTGGAIKGVVRADLFFGFGPEAEQLAGNMKAPGRLFVLTPRAR